jgi:putative oxidoreductase
MNIGLLILRLVVGAFVAAHGIQKMTHLWGGGGLSASTEEFRNDGFAGGAATALLAGVTQIGAGALLVLGLLTPLAAAGVAGVMTVAATVKLRHGFWSPHDGYEYPALLTVMAIVTAWTGPGRYSLDAAAGLTRYWTTWPAVAATVAGLGAALLLRLVLHRPQSVASQPKTPVKAEGKLA